jgi:hypothetical protein
VIEFTRLREPAFPEKPDDFLKSGVLGQSVDVVAAIAQNTRISIDITNL